MAGDAGSRGIESCGEITLIDPQPIRSYNELVDYMRLRREQIGISNETLEQIIGLTKGHADKLLGPSRVKNLTRYTLDCFLAALAIKLIPAPDHEREAEMSGRYEQRNQCQVRKLGRVSQDTFERVKPHVFAALGRAGGLKRAASLPAKQRSRIARAAALSRWRRHRKLRRELAASAARAGSENRESAP
jgi:hypothetical protein